MFDPIPSPVSFPKLEEEVLTFWREARVYEQSLAQRAGAPDFVFYEGPPTANGMPHPGHCLTRAIKDVFPRYKTMRGFRCERKAGWDTHGLPVEVEVCKELGIHSKDEIEAFGVEPFIQKCQASVWRYMQEWRRLTERLGFWVNLDEAYVTYHQSFVESVWWSLKQFYDRGLLYQGHKIVWWWAQGGTALSAGEVGQGYRQVADPSVYVKFLLVNVEENDPLYGANLLVWTTTPWTLPSNQYAAVNPELEYALIVDAHEGASEKLIIATALVETIANKLKRSLNVVGTITGRELLNKQYLPPYISYFKRAKWRAWYVVPAEFVTTDSGTGIVHQAPAFGEVDYAVLVSEQAAAKPSHIPQLINCVGPDGKFTAEAPEFVRGRWVKDCDKDIIRDLKSRGLLYHQEQYLHDYPFCWRAEEDPLIQYPRESWFIKTSQFVPQMLGNNAEINWLPEHIKDGRFGKFLESNVDWALSRERYWGTPLPIWQCEETGKQEAIGGYDELLAKPGVTGTEVWAAAKQANPELPEDLKVHKPYIDAVTYDSPFSKGARMKRVTEVIDCWYDSGAMPFAQWGYRGEPTGSAAEKFKSQFPADFISEAIDQTRGWFYSQLAISTLLWGEKQAEGSRQQAVAAPSAQTANSQQPTAYPHPFKNCIVLGLMLGEDGQKMSKSKRNYREPREIFDKYGADALRWYLFANQPPWTSIRYSEQAIKDSIPEFLLRLWNCYSFFVIYANIDGWKPSGQQAAGSGQQAEIDRWILSELNRTVAIVTERMDAYDNFGACGALTAFVDALSNWYVRRNRDRFWASDKQSADKIAAYDTLFECLVTTTKLIAPFTPFLAETMWRNLRQGLGSEAPESVHLCDYPSAKPAAIDEVLSERMRTVRLIASLGRNARSGADLKVRQPLARVEVILADPVHQAWLEEHAGVIADELNVKLVEFSQSPEKYVDYEVLPNFKLLGKKLGKRMPLVKPALAACDGAELMAKLKRDGAVQVVLDGETVELTSEELEVRLTAKPGWAAASEQGVVVVLNTELTPELVSEGYARDLVRVIQDRRKELGLEFTDRIEVGVESNSAECLSALNKYSEYISAETLADRFSIGKLQDADSVVATLGEHSVNVFVRRA